MSSIQDDGDLFGDKDSDGSLFGDGDDAGSLFGDGDNDEMSVELLANVEVDEARAAAPTPTLTLPMPGAQPVYGGLTLPPNGSDPHGALSRSHVGHTSDHQVVSTPNPFGNERGLSLPSAGVQHPEAVVGGQARDDQTIDTFAASSHGHGNQAGHASGEEAPQSSLDLAFASDTEMSDDLERQLEHDLLQDLDMLERVNTVTANAVNPPEDHQHQNHQQLATLGLDKVDFQYAKCSTYRGVRLPRQVEVDLDESGIRYLTPYVSLRRNDSCKLHYERLEITGDMGARLSKDLRTYIESSEDAIPLLRKGTAGVDPNKRRGDYLRLSIGLLKTQGWGDKWFGPACETGRVRKLVWPADSTLIILRFVGLVYKFVDQAKYQKTRKQDYRARAAMTPALSQYSTGSSQSSAIDLTADDDYMSQGLILTPITSAAPSRPTSSHIPDHSQHQPPPAIFSQELASYGPTPFPQSRLPVLPDYVSPTTQELRRLNEEKVNEAGAMTPAFNVTLAGNGGPLLTPIHVGDGITNVNQLAERVVGIKRRKLQPVPMQDKVDYRFFFVDKMDGLELCSPVTFDMAADLVKGDVVANLKAAFAKAGDPALIYIYTPTGYREIRELREWNEAVHAVWLQNGDGTSVNVAIHI